MDDRGHKFGLEPEGKKLHELSDEDLLARLSQLRPGPEEKTIKECLRGRGLTWEEIENRARYKPPPDVWKG